MMHLEHVGLTDKGHVREKNEDAMLIAPELGLFAVCDGMGGHVGGQVASQLAVKTIAEVVGAGDAAKDASDPDILSTAIRRANKAIYSQARADPTLHNMGTTVVAVRREGDFLHVCHVGDSRIYRLRGGRLEQLTRDHSLVNLYEDNPELAVHFGPPNDNVIVRAVGLREDVDVDHKLEPMQVGDVYLLCCDGLTDMVDDWMLEPMMDDASESNLQEACEAMIRAALNNGGVDNTTAVLVRVVEQAAAT